jgi:predicted nucleic acid-binding protein
MRHVFVESNWVFAYAAPAHHKRTDAVELLRRARVGEVKLHLPAPCITEARYPVVTKCQPRNEADAVRRFLLRARIEQTVSPDEERITRGVLDRFERQVQIELSQLDEIIASLRRQPGLEIFALNDSMLDRAVDLSTLDLALKPFDQAILAAVLVRAEELLSVGENDLSFCETDTDLQPWDRKGNAKKPLTDLYDTAKVWVYGDFDLLAPERPHNWPG